MSGNDGDTAPSNNEGKAAVLTLRPREGTLRSVTCPPVTSSERMNPVSDPWPPVDEDRYYERLFPRVRSILGLTQEELADALEVARLTVIRWETQGATPKPEQLDKVEALLREYLLEQFRFLRQKVKEIAASSSGRSSAVKREERDRILVDVALDGLGIASESRRVAASLAKILTFGGRTLLASNDWVSALGLGDRILHDVPVAHWREGRAFYWGYDVGYALSAAALGITYPELLAGAPNLRLTGTGTEFAELRLLSEAELRRQVTQLWIAAKTVDLEERAQSIGLRAASPAAKPQQATKRGSKPKSRKRGRE